MKESEFPALYGDANALSINAQKQFFTALAGNLSCLIFASALSVANLPNIWFAGLQVVTLLIGLGLTIFLAAKKPQQSWYGARALAESVKTVTWRYMMRAEPYDIDDANARYHFTKTLKKILDANQQVIAQAMDTLITDQITLKMEEIRSSGLKERQQFYKEFRISEQQEWYRRKGRTNSRNSKRWFVALIIINSLAILWSLGKMIYPSQEHWPTDIFVTAAGSVMAWLQTKRYQELAASYTLTAHEIGLLRLEQPNSLDENAHSIFVSDAENAFSREHTQWQARRDKD
ncbi:DUF4231 domain-containing protein [Roseomonas sp. KE2513]|uniref:DUF4231 domain-containing protein n=1 Tax=Roseomonas sp. KE2513 TaxID=2479202 RepID=UPI0018DFD370|nr:DUF4231 domain-containing protein [Roseomonas sp. KE2513]